MKRTNLVTLLFLLVCSASVSFSQTDADSNPKYKLLATTRTGTMQKEIDEVSAQGYRILVGSPTSGSEMAVFLSKEGSPEQQFKYKLLATTRTGTMNKELNEMADAGYRLIPSTMIAKSQLIGGVEIVMIMERPPVVVKQYEYKLLATSRTSTLQKEVTEAQDAGYKIVGMVSRGEHMVVMEREVDAVKP
ncbi:MAG: hypothetical protein QUS14_14970 [Pyrinomonadaceae bacterium]|nr:hypothetical protein [Pyrinomonadaceae bacterium]